MNDSPLLIFVNVLGKVIDKKTTWRNRQDKTYVYKIKSYENALMTNTNYYLRTFFTNEC